MTYKAAQTWGAIYGTQSEMAFPAEGVIRIFKGRFPGLEMARDSHAGRSILDLGCGDGRHLPLFHSLGMAICAVEITDAISATLRDRMAGLGVPADIRTGHAGAIPFEAASFDRLLTWNSAYYMTAGGSTFEAHVDEMARVLKPSGWIIASVPKRTSFIFKDSEESDPGYRIIANDYFDGARNGERMRCFADRAELQAAFAPRFEGFCHADLDMEWFGLPYHWHVFCARKCA